MTRYVIGPDVALQLAQREAQIAEGHVLLAPTLLRSQLLALLYRSVQAGAMTKKEADGHLAYVRGLRLRLLGDRVLQNVAWQLAAELGWPDTLDAEYIALTRLQADAFVTLDGELAAAVKGLVVVASYDELVRQEAGA